MNVLMAVHSGKALVHDTTDDIAMSLQGKHQPACGGRKINGYVLPTGHIFLGEVVKVTCPRCPSNR